MDTGRDSAPWPEMSLQADPTIERLSSVWRQLRHLMLGIAVLAGTIVVLDGLLNGSAGSVAAMEPGTLILGLGLGAAILYALVRDTSVGILVWVVLALFSTAYPEAPVSLDRLAFVALAAGWFVSVVTHRRPLRAFGLTEGLLAAYVLLALGSYLAPHDLPAQADLTPLSLFLTGAFLPAALFVLARQALTDTRAVRNFLWFLVWIGLYLSAVMILQGIDLEELVWPRTIVDASKGIGGARARGPSLNAAADGTLLVVCFVAAMYLGARAARFRRVALAGALTMPLAIFFTQTRAVWLAAGFVVLLGAMSAFGFRRWYVAVLAGVVAVVGANWQAFLSADRVRGGVTSSGEIDARLNDIATLLSAIRAEPVFGVGISRYPDFNALFHQTWGTVDYKFGVGVIAHNTPLVIGAELGLLGLAVAGAALVAIGVTSARAWRALPRTGFLSKGLVLSFWLAGLAFLVNSSVIDMRLFPGVSAVVFVWAGLVAALADRAARGELATELELDRGGRPPARHAALPRGQGP